MARRKRPAAVVVDDSAPIPADLLAGPVVETWVPAHEWDRLLERNDPDRAGMHGPTEAEKRALVLLCEARRRWNHARRRWADENGLDDRTTYRLIPKRGPRFAPP